MKNSIPLELLAEKFADAANHEAPQFSAALAAEPRARELLLYLQAQSAKEGGLTAFVQNFALQCPGLLGTPTLLLLSGKTFTAKERDAILDEIPENPWQFDDTQFHVNKESKWMDENLWRKVRTVETNRYSPFEPPVKCIRHEDFIGTLDRAAFHRLCCGFIGEFLPAELHRVCTIKDAWFAPAWYCDDLTAALIQMMDATAAEAASKLAQTAVAKSVFDALEFTIQRKAFVRLDGNSRYGKTECIRTFAAMHPGKCRLVSTDCMNTDKDFFGAIADALGMERDHTTTAARLRMRIDYIARHCGLCFIFDEAHFLFPSVASKSRRPTRLDWIRTHLVDRGSPVVIVTTPQIYDAAAVRLREFTGYNFDQWDGRIRRHVRLPEKISAADLLAVVQKKAPDFDEDWQQMTAEAASLVPGSYLAAVQAIIDTTLWFAQSARRSKPSLDDLERAIAEAAPNAAPAPAPAPEPEPPRPTATKRSRSIRPARTALEAPARSITPATELEPA